MKYIRLMMLILVGGLTFSLAGCKDEEVGSIELELDRMKPSRSHAWPLVAGPGSAEADMPVVYTFSIENNSPYVYKGGVIEVTVAGVHYVFMDVRTNHIGPGERGEFTFSVSRDDPRGKELWDAIKRHGNPEVRITSFKL